MKNPSMDNSHQRRNHRIGRERWGKIKVGQTWVKPDTGATFLVIKKMSGSAWMVAFDFRGRGSSHRMEERDIYKFYDRVV